MCGRNVWPLPGYFLASLSIRVLPAVLITLAEAIQDDTITYIFPCIKNVFLSLFTVIYLSKIKLGGLPTELYLFRLKTMQSLTLFACVSLIMYYAVK